MGCLGYMVTKKYVMGCLPDTSSMGVCDGIPRIYGYKMVCDGMPHWYMVIREYVMGCLP